jgi:hypothetical protein
MTAGMALDARSQSALGHASMAAVALGRRSAPVQRENNELLLLTLILISVDGKAINATNASQKAVAKMDTAPTNQAIIASTNVDPILISILLPRL